MNTCVFITQIKHEYPSSLIVFPIGVTTHLNLMLTYFLVLFPHNLIIYIFFLQNNAMCRFVWFLALFFVQKCIFFFLSINLFFILNYISLSLLLEYPCSTMWCWFLYNRSESTVYTHTHSRLNLPLTPLPPPQPFRSLQSPS